MNTEHSIAQNAIYLAKSIERTSAQSQQEWLKAQIVQNANTLIQWSQRAIEIQQRSAQRVSSHI